MLESFSNAIGQTFVDYHRLYPGIMSKKTQIEFFEIFSYKILLDNNMTHILKKHLNTSYCVREISLSKTSNSSLSHYSCFFSFQFFDVVLIILSTTNFILSENA